VVRDTHLLGYENKVATNLRHRIESMGMQDKIFDVLIPKEP